MSAKDLKHKDPYDPPQKNKGVGSSPSSMSDGLGFASLSSREAQASAWLRMTRTVLQVCTSTGPTATRDVHG